MRIVNDYRTGQHGNLAAIFENVKKIIPGTSPTDPTTEWNKMDAKSISAAKQAQKDLVKKLYKEALGAALADSHDSAKDAVKTAMQNLIDRAVDRINFEYSDIKERNGQLNDKNLQKLSTAISLIHANKHNLQNELKNSKSALYQALDEPRTSVFKFRLSTVLREIASAFKKLPASTDKPEKNNNEQNNNDNRACLQFIPTAYVPRLDRGIQTI